MRPSYQYQQQLPSSHVENIERYLGIMSSLVPRDPTLSRFCIRHPDLQQNNIIVSEVYKDVSYVLDDDAYALAEYQDVVRKRFVKAWESLVDGFKV
jgi:hypothetical protein